MEDAGETPESSDGENATPCKRQRTLGGPDQTAGASAQPAASALTVGKIYKDGPRPTRTRRQWSTGVLTGGRVKYQWSTQLGPNGPPGQSQAVGADSQPPGQFAGACSGFTAPGAVAALAAASPTGAYSQPTEVVAAATRLERAAKPGTYAQDLSIVLSSIVKLMSENEYHKCQAQQHQARIKELKLKLEDALLDKRNFHEALNAQLTRENEQRARRGIAVSSQKQKIMEGMREHAVEVKNLVHESEVNVTRNGN